MISEDAIKWLHNELLMQALAAGLEESDAVFRRFGIDPEEQARLEKSEVFKKNIAIVRDEMERDGSLTKLRARWMALDLLQKTYTLAASNDATLDERLEALKTIARIADLEKPSPVAQQGGGPSFQINISLPTTSQPAISVQPAIAPEPKELPSGDS